MDGPAISEFDYSEFVEVDPTGRYGRYNEVLGKGASKTVYKAFDEYEGIEVAWNQVKLYDSLRSPEDLERLYCEIHLLKTLKHENIMKFYTSWVDVANRNINFVTEMFTSGTLRQFRLKHRRVNIRAVKHWCRQILKGLLYLHSHNPPVIHRDLKCDNIFVNGNQGEVKIGDLGLAAILRKSHVACCVGTPEFMAPEVYQEEYNELVDIYSFGMSVLEMVTLEYPYSECTHPAQIYKKVISGKKPDSLYKVQDPEVRNFVEKCLATVSIRPSARELLEDPFLQGDDLGSDFVPLNFKRDPNGPLIRQPHYVINYNESSFLTTYSSSNPWYYAENEQEHSQIETEMGEIDLFTCYEEEHLANIDISIRGRRRENDGIFLRLRIADKEGCIRNIYFTFDIETDTALSVAAEMVSELDITDQDVLKIANMIDGEIATLVPEWKKGHGTGKGLHHPDAGFCQNCSSQGYLLDYVSSNSPAGMNLQVLHCSRHYCTAAHCRFEEITYQVEGTEHCADIDCMASVSNQSIGINYTDIWAQRDVQESSSQGTREIHYDDGIGFQHEASFDKEERIIHMDSLSTSSATNSISLNPSTNCGHWDNYENEIRQELRWLKTKYEMQLSELRDQQSEVKSNSSIIIPNSDDIHELDNGGSLLLIFHKEERQAGKPLVNSVSPEGHSTHFPNSGNRCASSANKMVKNSEAIEGAYSPDLVSTARSFFGRTLIPHSLQRATSLPVDVIDV